MAALIWIGPPCRAAQVYMLHYVCHCERRALGEEINLLMKFDVRLMPLPLLATFALINFIKDLGIIPIDYVALIISLNCRYI